MRRLVALPVAFAVLTVTAAGCKHDGRYMRPALPSQNGSVSTSAAPTVPSSGGDFFGTVAAEQAASTTTLVISTTTEVASTTAVPTTTTAPTAALKVTAPWPDGGPIDPRYTCKGDNVAPALSWSPAPAGTQQIAITMADLDLTSFDHWSLAGIAPAVTTLAENAVPDGAITALNGGGTVGYTGPCPPAGATHTYRITVHYLDRALPIAPGGAAGDLRAAIDASTTATAEVSGTFTGS